MRSTSWQHLANREKVLCEVLRQLPVKQQHNRINIMFGTWQNVYAWICIFDHRKLPSHEERTLFVKNKNPKLNCCKLTSNLQHSISWDKDVYIWWLFCTNGYKMPPHKAIQKSTVIYLGQMSEQSGKNQQVLYGWCWPLHQLLQSQSVPSVFSQEDDIWK